ncbi:hypothetical protein ACFL0H_12760 [Thermodesulfobacteriota bacterium]
MKKISFGIIMLLFIVALPITSSFAQTVILPARLIVIVKDLESYAKQNGISIDRDEDLKDIVTLGYLNAVKRLNVPFGSLNDIVKMETVQWLSILCWFPNVPPEAKEPVKKDLKKTRKALAKNAYKRTIATLSLTPGFAVTCVGEVLNPKMLNKFYPITPMGGDIYKALERGRLSPSKDLVESLKRKKMMYSDIMKAEWIEEYLK